jgi:hypothetical protein
VRLEGLGQLKNPMTSLGFEPATFDIEMFQMKWLPGALHLAKNNTDICDDPIALF